MTTYLFSDRGETDQNVPGNFPYDNMITSYQAGNFTVMGLKYAFGDAGESTGSYPSTCYQYADRILVNVAGNPELINMKYLTMANEESSQPGGSTPVSTARTYIG